jgi:hypothetical protein
MAPINLALTTVIPGGSAAPDATDAGGVAPSQVVYHIPPATQASAGPSDATQQDTVTLSGSTPATRSPIASQNFVPAAAFTLLAHEFTFPPNDSENGAGLSESTNSNSAGAPAHQTTVAQEQSPAPALTQGSVNATAVAVAANAAQPAPGINPANAAANSPSSAAETSASVMAPEETLQQLDQELQRLGINPQDISLMNRMSLLLWVNDPVALRQFVQGMQPSALTAAANAATNASSAQTSAAQLGAGGANANRGAGAVQIQPGMAQSQVQNQRAVIAQFQTQIPVQVANQNSSFAQSSRVVDSGSPVSANLPDQQTQTAAAVLQLQKLHASLAAAAQGAQVVISGGSNSQTQGQFVNISA